MSMFPTNILLATDGSASAAPALRAAADLSAKTDSGVQVIYVGKGVPAPGAYNDPGQRDSDASDNAHGLLEEQTKQIEELGGKVVNTQVVPGKKPAEEIVKLTREEDIGLVVIGSRGLGRLRYAIQGSVSGTVVREAYCPVLVVHGDADV